QRAREAGYNPALRQVGNRLVGILHGCLKTRTPTTKRPVALQNGFTVSGLMVCRKVGLRGGTR
ncbi:hypothetical protein, partial [Streptomyces sp. NPDC056227]|uniref:hypothetical protein n=1 Tax=Streptomyces sp. NPDC056227 TaxID=3345753 RepID=UPI0035D770E3